MLAYTEGSAQCTHDVRVLSPVIRHPRSSTGTQAKHFACLVVEVYMRPFTNPTLAYMRGEMKYTETNAATHQ